MSLSIQETDSNLFLFYPKSNDLEIKFYNPSFWESLGFQGVSISVVKTPSIEDTSGSTVSPQTGGSPDPTTHSVSFPYNQFVFLLKGNPEQPSRVDAVFQQYAATQTDTEKRPAGLYGVFFPVLDSIYNTLFAKSKTEPAPAPEPTPAPAPASSSVLSSLMPTQQTETQPVSNTGVSMPSLGVDVSKSLPDVSKNLEMKPTEIKEPSKTLYSSMMEYLSPTKSETQVLEQKPEPVPVSVSVPSQPSVVSPEVPVEQTKPIEALPPQPSVVSPEVHVEQTKPIEALPPQPTVVSPEVPIIPVSEPEKTEPTAGQLFWKLVVPKLSNPPKVFEPSDIAEKYEQHFRDVLLQSKMETKSGIYVSGSFYSVLGRKVKIGTVEPSSPSKHTLRDYLQTVPELEGSIMSKYKKMLS